MRELKKTIYTDEWIVRQSKNFLDRMFDTEHRKGMKIGAEIMFIYMKTLVEARKQESI